MVNYKWAVYKSCTTLRGNWLVRRGFFCYVFCYILPRRLQRYRSKQGIQLSYIPSNTYANC